MSVASHSLIKPARQRPAGLWRPPLSRPGPPLAPERETAPRGWPTGRVLLGSPPRASSAARAWAPGSPSGAALGLPPGLGPPLVPESPPNEAPYSQASYRNRYSFVRSDTRETLRTEVMARLELKHPGQEVKSPSAGLAGMKSEDEEPLSALTCEGDAVISSSGRTVECSVQVGQLAPAETRTVRGRLYLHADGSESLRNLFQEDVKEWQKVLSFRMSIPGLGQVLRIPVRS